MDDGRVEDAAFDTSPELRRQGRRAHWLALLCPIAAVVAAFIGYAALRFGLEWLGLPYGGPDGYRWIYSRGIVPLAGVLGTIGAMTVACRLQPVPEDRFGAGVIWFCFGPFIYIVTLILGPLTIPFVLP